MTQPQPNALAAITAALQAKQPGFTQPTAAAPTQQAFTFTPVAQVPVPAPPAVNPFQPTPQQAAAAFVAAVPQAAQQHAHPTTGVPFAPINPPGEASAPPTAGLDAAPPQVLPTIDSVAELVGSHVQPAGATAPKARGRKPRAPSIETVVLPPIEAMVGTMNPAFAGAGAVEPAAASVTPSASAVTFGTLGLQDFTTEDLRDELVRRGYRVRLA